MTQRLVGSDGRVTHLELAKGAPPAFQAIAGTDARRGASLVVWAINEGRECADAVCRDLADTA